MQIAILVLVACVFVAVLMSFIVLLFVTDAAIKMMEEAKIILSELLTIAERFKK